MESCYLFDCDTHKAGGPNDTALHDKTSLGGNVTLGIVFSRCILTLQCNFLAAALWVFFFCEKKDVSFPWV